jgi:hypothetical protein
MIDSPRVLIDLVAAVVVCRCRDRSWVVALKDVRVSPVHIILSAPSSGSRAEPSIDARRRLQAPMLAGKGDRMSDEATGDRVRGKRLRWTFAEGPQAGKTYEHVFHGDGTVEYRAVEDGTGGAPGGERPQFAAYAVSDTVELVSYRAESGFTLTVALNFADHSMVGIASNSEQWFPARGVFQVGDG